jgi:hypothetical protein
MSKQSSPINNIFIKVIESRPYRSISRFILIPVLIFGALLLPPISLADRLLGIGYESIDPNGDVLQASDGVQITFRPASGNRAVRVRLDAVSPADLLDDTADNRLRLAAESIPPHLTPKSPFYRIQYRGDAPQAVLLTVPIYGEGDFRHTLDLVAWNGDAWEWLPNRKIAARSVIEAELDYLPEAVAVMQTSALKPRLATDLILNTTQPAFANDVLIEINLQGLSVGSGGEISGELDQVASDIQKAKLPIIPTIRSMDKTLRLVSGTLRLSLS